MVYYITNYTRKQAKKMGVIVKPSTNKTKKIEVLTKARQAILYATQQHQPSNRT